jgi:hypothetical protein
MHKFEADENYTDVSNQYKIYWLRNTNIFNILFL